MRWFALPERRRFSSTGFRLSLLLFVGVVLAAQSTPAGKPQKSRIKPGPVDFEDIAQQVGLRALNVYGNHAHKEFIIETTGNGAVILYYNNREGTFTDVTAAAGLGRSGWGQGACVGGYDNDGYLNLFVTYWGQSVLYHNNGDVPLAM